MFQSTQTLAGITIYLQVNICKHFREIKRGITWRIFLASDVHLDAKVKSILNCFREINDLITE